MPIKKTNRKKTNRKKTNRKKTNRKSIKKMIGGNMITFIVINNNTYDISLYEKIKPEHIINESIHMCSGMYQDVNNVTTAEDVKDLIEETSNDIYILKNSSTNEIVSFIIISNNCDEECFYCNKKCIYILLTCTKKDKRGKKMFSHFLTGVEEHLKTKNINCIRLTAVNDIVLGIYSKLGFHTEKSDNFECYYKMIKQF